MEPVGLAVGLVGLAGLFNTCLDVLDKFESWKDCESESQALMAQFEAHKLQLDKWGQAVGIQNGAVSNQHDKLLDDPRVLKIVMGLLSAINYICGAHGPHMQLESRRQKLSWALRAKMKLTAQVSQLSSILQTLYSLVPIHPDVVARNDEPSAKESDISISMSDVSQSQDNLIAEFQRLMTRIESGIEGEERRHLQAWLLGNHPPNDRYEFFTGKRIEGTCEWVLSHSWVQNWSSRLSSNQPPPILWINGPAGFGKTVLSTRILEHFSSIPDAKIAHFFFSADFERDDPFLVVRTWISQLMALSAPFTVARKIWAAQQGLMATLKDIMNLLREILVAVPECMFLMDGLDECADDSISIFMEALMEAMQGTAARLIILSRDEPEIRELLYYHTNSCSVVEHRITPEDVRADVMSYARKIVYKELKKSTEATRNDLSQKLADRCNGQFLWVSLQQESLRRNNWRSPKEIEKKINSTPTGLATLYEQNWVKISNLPEEDRDRALSLLRWAAFSLRPLSVNEITEALLISETCDEVNIDELPEIIDDDYVEKGLSYYCGSLLEISTDDIDVPHVNGWTPLNSAIKQDHIEVIKLLLDKGADITLKNSDGWTPVNSVSETGNLEVVKLLLESGADITVKNNGGWTSLNVASSHGHLEVVKLLLTEEPDINSRNSAGWTPVNSVSEKGHLEVVRLLLERGADITVKNNNRWTPLNISLNHGHLEIVRLFLRNRADIAVGSNDGWMPANAALSNGYFKVVTLLLVEGADINLRNSAGWTPVNSVSKKGHLKVVRLLLERGADITVKNNNRWTPLNISSNHGHLEVVKLLLEKGADITVPNYNEWTPLHSALKSGHQEIVELLIKSGADLEALDSHGWTPMHLACQYGRIEAVEHFISLRGRIEIRDNFGRTPLFHAAERCRSEAIRVLLSHGAATTVQDRYNATALCIAIRNSHEEIVEILLPLADSIGGFEDGLGRNLVWWAAKTGNRKLIDLVVQWAQKMGIDVYQDLDAEVGMIQEDKSSTISCDACTRFMTSGRPYYHCKSCHDSDMCLDCHEIGAQCFDASHEFDLRNPGGSFE